MDGISLAVSLKNFGLRVDNDNVVYNPGREGARQYFMITDFGSIILWDSRVYNLSDIISVTYQGNGVDRIDFTLYNSTKTSIGPGLFPNSLRLTMSDMVSSRTMPKTDSELNDLFETLYPDYKTKLYYDVLSETKMYDPSLFNDTLEPGTFCQFNEDSEYEYIDNIERKLKAIGCTGRPPAIDVRQRVIRSKFKKNERNPFKEWVMSRVWDGVPRIDTWFQKMFNASAPQLRPYGMEVEKIYLAKVARAWFIGAIARMFEATQHEVVPIFIGPQQCGKSTGVAYCAGDPKWFIDTISDVSTPQAITSFLDTVRGRIVVELAECSSLRKTEQNALKAFITKSIDQYRKPYARETFTYPRHFIMAATSNITEIFTDMTGNRRFFPIFCSQMEDITVRTQYEVEQVWAEAYVLYLCGEEPKIPIDWFPAQHMQDITTQPNMKVEVIDNWLNDPENGFSENGAVLTKKQLMKEMFQYADYELIRKEHEVAWTAWTVGTKNWVPIQFNVDFTRKTSERAYKRISEARAPTEQKVQLTSDELEVLRNKVRYQADMVNEEKSPEFNALQTFLKACTNGLIKGVNQPVDTCDGYTSYELKALAKFGYLIRIDQANDKYVVLHMPTEAPELIKTKRNK